MPSALKIVFFAAAVITVGTGCSRKSADTPPAKDVALKSSPPAAVSAAPRVELRWQLTGRSSRPSVPCKEVSATEVVLRFGKVDQPEDTADTFRLPCEGGQAGVPVAAGRYRFRAELFAADGRVLSRTPEGVEAFGPGAPTLLVFEVADGSVIQAVIPKRR